MIGELVYLQAPCVLRWTRWCAGTRWTLVFRAQEGPETVALDRHLSPELGMGRGFPRIGRILTGFSGCICAYQSNLCRSVSDRYLAEQLPWM